MNRFEVAGFASEMLKQAVSLGWIGRMIQRGMIKRIPPLGRTITPNERKTLVEAGGRQMELLMDTATRGELRENVSLISAMFPKIRPKDPIVRAMKYVPKANVIGQTLSKRMTPAQQAEYMALQKQMAEIGAVTRMRFIAQQLRRRANP